MAEYQRPSGWFDRWRLVVDAERLPGSLLDAAVKMLRLEAKQLRMTSPFELSYGIVSAMIRREADLIADFAKESGQLEQRVMLEEDMEDPEAFLEELFQVWYVLLALRTIATHSSASYGRMARLVRFLPDAAPPLFADIADQFDVIKTMADGQREFLHGVIEFYQTRTSTHLTIAAEKSASTGVQQNEDMRRITAWVAIVAVPTAVTGFFGQNVPYPGFETTAGFVASTLIIIILALALFIIFKRKGWL